VIKYEALLAGVEEAPVFGNDVDVRTGATCDTGRNRNPAVEETTACNSGFVVADADGTAVAGMNAHPCVVTNHERHRAPVAKPECVRVARCSFVSARQYEAVVGVIAVHSERNSTFFYTGVRDE
jgi:hypothetical protein